MGICSTLWTKASKYLFLKEELLDERDFSDEELLRQAQEEIVRARNIFTRVDDPEMIDYAIFNLKAAEKRYSFLLKKIKNR